ncbi:HD-GYP domain-containing protein [Agrobacterium sp. Ap1]|uniref:HD-GYP domain-containing protein n=1 Tax=Agrobacterium sp. Ap1 TaxID=2815337 RepID=UPI001A8F4995|nr:HD-GYP domain-containing protein [Agrobacterium sp. Ap1]MBO0144627.1 HD-GYP domain-containing protein [Agrobacterium sp. Ap1]
MKKRIRLHQVRVGMYVEELEGAVLSLPHLGPVASPFDVDLMMNSHAISVVINTQKGLDVDSDHNEVQLDLIDFESTLASKFSGRQIWHAQEAIQDARRSVSDVLVEARLRGALYLDAADKAVERIMLAAMTNAGAMIAVAKLKKKDEGTFLHSLAVSALMVTFGRNLGLSEEAVRVLGLGGLIHDLGKMMLPIALLRKPGKLTVEEMDLIRTHPERGYEMAKRIAGMPRPVLDICLYHHEKFDGTGYPHRLAGSAIPHVARIAAICDVYDALTSVRPYKRAWSQAEAIETMMRSTGHFDPDLMKAFVSKMVINGTIH